MLVFLLASQQGRGVQELAACSNGGAMRRVVGVVCVWLCCAAVMDDAEHDQRTCMAL